MEALQKIAGFVRDPNVTIDTGAFIFALFLSLVVSLLVAYLYRAFYEDRSTGAQVHRSFVLLGPSITALFIAIQFSLPLSLGLLGALSVIRFRTPIKEPEEVGFIMLLCACSIVIATFKLLLLLALLVTVIIGLIAKHYLPNLIGNTRRDGTILLSFTRGGVGWSLSDVQTQVLELIPRSKIESLSETQEFTTLQISFCDLSTDSVEALKTYLMKIEEYSSLNLYFNRSTSLM